MHKIYRAAIASVAVLCALTTGIPAQAQQSQASTWCYASEADGVSLDLKISGCSTEILSGTLSNSDLALAYTNRGFAYSTKGQLDRAIQDYDQAIKLDPSNAIAYYNRGIAYSAKGQFDRAIQDFDQAIEHDPSDADAFYGRSLARAKKGDKKGADADLAAARRNGILLNFVQAAQRYDLPPGGVVIEERPIKSAAHSNRALLLWMINPERNPRPREWGEVYTCPEYTRGNYYSGATRVSLVNTRTRRIINTLNIVGEGNPTINMLSDNDSFAIPYLIDRRFLYRVPAPRNGSEGKPVVMWLQDYNGDGRAQEFALFDALACMPILTTLIGYSEAQDRVIQYSAEIEVISGTERTTEKMYWVDYLFSMKPVRPGYWKYEIDYRGRGGALAKHEVRYNARRERFEGRFVLEPDPAE